jgi:hypothetical protein
MSLLLEFPITYNLISDEIDVSTRVVFQACNRNRDGRGAVI